MNEAVERTFHVLTSSKGKAARRTLHFAISSSEPSISLLASRKVLEHNSAAGIFELVKKFNRLTPEQYDLLAANTEKLGPPVRMALLNEDHIVQENALSAIRKLRPYALIPLLMQHLDHGSQSGHTGVAQWAVNHLVEFFTQEFHGHVPRKTSYGYILSEIVESLEKGFASWQTHERMIFLDVFFRLSERLDVLGDELREMTANPNHPAHGAFIRKLAGSQDPHVMRFLVRQLESTVAPNSLLVAAARREDRAFLRMLLESVGYHPSVALQENLSRIKRFEGRGNLRAGLAEFDEGRQRFLVELVRCSGMGDYEKTAVYENVLRFGNRHGKTAVLEHLRQSATPDGDRLVILAIESDDPEVQAAALSQLRERKVRNSTGLLLRYVDSPHERVRQTISDELTEFRMDRMLQSLDALSDEQRKFMLKIVKKIDPKMRETIARELENPEQRQKDFLLNLITEEKTVVTYEASLMKLVEQENDFFLRLKALKLLALGINESSRQFLKDTAERDANTEVRILAKRVYEIRGMARNQA